ncbi:MAG: hypothetical protein ISS92_04640 [Candidatus Omnitrophica bacterium]|nr:hypothetical protein [Candidatus Omnitrophota bacterium]
MVKIIWNRDFAYGIGLIATDGCLSSDGRHIEFSSKDLESVNNFKKSFKLKNRIGRKTRGTLPDKLYHRIQFGNVKFYKFLLTIGLSPRKSHTLKGLRVPKHFFADFLRGVIDGDGSIGYFMHPESKKKQFRVRIASASIDFLKWLKNKINKLLPIKGSIKLKTRAYELCYYKNDSKKLVNFIYYDTDIVYLKRKYKIAETM